MVGWAAGTELGEKLQFLLHQGEIFHLWSKLGDEPRCRGRMLVSVSISVWAPALWVLSSSASLDEQSPRFRG